MQEGVGIFDSAGLIVGAHEMALGQTRNERRDFDMLRAAEAGESLQSLAELYGLTPQRVQAILTMVRHKVAVSPNPTYRAIREAE